MRKRLKTVERHPEIEINAKRFRLHGDKDYQRNTITLTVLGNRGSRRNYLQSFTQLIIIFLNSSIFVGKDVFLLWYLGKSTGRVSSCLCIFHAA